jgi:FKBP-type peptidyl-prolyl cis-trans isomerase
VSVHYTGWLTNGTAFDTSLGGTPIAFKIGGGNLLVGFEEGIVGMKVGGKRRLIIPPNLGYGANEVRDAKGNVVIPANSTIIFDVQLMAVSN